MNGPRLRVGLVKKIETKGVFLLTSRRILLLVGGLLFFLGSYSVYAFFFSGINGLPPLPESFLPGAGGDNLPLDPAPEGLRARMIKMAFGEGSVEVERDFKLLIRDKGIVLASGQPLFNIDGDGRVKLSPFSAAIFPKSQKEGPYPEINTVQCDSALVTFDRPVTQASELASRKVIGVELRGGKNGQGVTITNNRRTPQKNDDIEVTVAQSPLFFDDRRNLIWTDGVVKLLDLQPQPHPTKITALGMELHLAKDAGPNRPKAPAANGKSEGASGVELLVLHANVDMHLWIDAADGFPGNPADFGPPGKAEKAGPKGPPEKSHIIIRTYGPFTHDLVKDIATFASPPPAQEATPLGPDHVEVMREHKERKLDHLVCDHLTIFFRKKASPGAGPRDTTTGDKEIDRAIATARPGREVVLTMDTQNLEAYGNELQYHCAKAGAGPKTILKGSPMHAVKDGHKIEAVELHLTGADRFGNGQQVFGKGPGQMDVCDKANPKHFPIHILWKDTLVSTRERDGDRFVDLWTLTTDAAFIDEEHKLELHGQKIHAWLEPNNDPRQAPLNASGGSKQKIRKVEAFDRVYASAPEVVIKRTERLMIVFKDMVGIGDRLPDLPAAAGVKAVSEKAALVSTSLPRISEPSFSIIPAVTAAPPLPPSPAAPVPMTASTPTPVKEQPRKPIQLDANDVVLYVATQGTKKQLQELIANGKVSVHQDGEIEKGIEKKGLDIDCDLLNLLHDPLGDTLVVYGDARKPARLEFSDTKLWGPKVTINQITNQAQVDGIGAMDMPTETNLEGQKTAKKDARITIHWNKDMQFDGQTAIFQGGVVAYQDNSSLKCESMTTKMDRRIVFREGKTSNKGAKVDRILCNERVYVLDEQRDPNGNLTQASVLECAHLNVDNLEGPTHASGPGRLRHLAPGNSEPNLTGQPVPPGAAPMAKEMMLTRIDFMGRMSSNTKAKAKNAKFLDGVELFHVPSDTLDANLNPDKLPKNGFYLRSDQLQMESRHVDAKTVQTMIAEKKVFFRTQEFFGYADIVKFDESKEQIIFEADGDNLVTLYKRLLDGRQQTYKGRKLIYNRKTGEFEGGGFKVINSSWLPSAPTFGEPGALAIEDLRPLTLPARIQSPLHGWTRMARISRSFAFVS